MKRILKKNGNVIDTKSINYVHPGEAIRLVGSSWADQSPFAVPMTYGYNISSGSDYMRFGGAVNPQGKAEYTFQAGNDNANVGVGDFTLEQDMMLDASLSGNYGDLMRLGNGFQNNPSVAIRKRGGLDFDISVRSPSGHAIDAYYPNYALALPGVRRKLSFERKNGVFYFYMDDTLLFSSAGIPANIGFDFRGLKISPGYTTNQNVYSLRLIKGVALKTG